MSQNSPPSAVPPAVPPGLDRWLGMGPAAASPPAGRGWWLLPSPDRPRVYFPCEPAGWGPALEMIHSPLRRAVVRLTLTMMRLGRTPPQRVAPPRGPLDDWLDELLPGAGPFRIGIYAGTPNYYVKETLQCLDSRGRVCAYVKLPRGPAAGAVVENERQALEELARRFPGGGFFPRLLGARDGLTVQTPPPAAAAKGPADPGILLDLLAQGFTTRLTWQDSPVRATLVDSVTVLDAAGAGEWSGSIAAVLQRFDADWGGDLLEHPFSHGDFIPWNLRPGPFAFDWEWAGPRLPGHDSFHYLWMPRILKEKQPDATRLWDLWTGVPGARLRGGRPVSGLDKRHARAYLAWQLGFYASASARNGESLADSGLLATLHRILLSLPE